MRTLNREKRKKNLLPVFFSKKMLKKFLELSDTINMGIDKEIKMKKIRTEVTEMKGWKRDYLVSTVTYEDGQFYDKEFSLEERELAEKWCLNHDRNNIKKTYSITTLPNKRVLVKVNFEGHSETIQQELPPNSEQMAKEWCESLEEPRTYTWEQITENGKYSCD